MNAGNVIKLHTWTGTNKSRIVAETKTLAERAIEATAALGFKVSSNAMADVLKANDIQTRRQSAMQAKISQLEDEREKYRQWLRRCIDTMEVQDWMLQQMAKDFASDTEMAGAIRRKRTNGKDA
jgi:hypothetical protein